MRIWVTGPHLGPVRSVLWSWSSRRPRYVALRRPWWSRRWFTARYWLLGLWAVEAAAWAAVGVFLAGRWLWRHREAIRGIRRMRRTGSS